MKSDVVVSIKQLSKWYGKTRGIDGVSFDIYRGEVFGFLGPNGAGKTTTIRTLLGLINPTSGEASILGLDAFEKNLELRKRIGYLPGVASTYTNYTARKYLAMMARLRGVDCTTKINEYAKRLEINLDMHIHDLSKGNKQKVAVIQAFMHEPELLFLDEPTSGLDPLVQREFEKILDEVKSRGATVILSSHVLSEVEHLANRVAIINEGKILLVDEIAALKAKAVRKIEFTFDHPVSNSDFSHLNQVKVISVDHNRVTLEVKGSERELIAKAAVLGATDVRTHDSSLDEIFVDLVGKK